MVRQHPRGRVIALFGCFLWLAQPVAHARAADAEERDFSILVDGKEAGQSRIVITLENDGSTVVTTNARVKINQLIFQYVYSVESTEYWKDGKLAALKTSATENHKRTEVTAASDGTQLKIRVNGQERPGSADDWTSSFWKLADARYHNKSVPILDPDTGKEYTGQLHYLGTEQLTFLNQPQSCYHFRVTGGGFPVDVWFDRYHRMVRQEFTDSGHKTIVQLIGLKR
jgi:hypothetical protein